jgi:hypothetical protein
MNKTEVRLNFDSLNLLFWLAYLSFSCRSVTLEGTHFSEVWQGGEQNFVVYGEYIRPGLTNLWRACPQSHAERFPWHSTFSAVPILFISFARPASLYCEEYVYIYIYMTPYRLHMNYRCYQIQDNLHIQPIMKYSCC